MSVILTSCRHSKQRAIARALKKRAEKQRVRRLLKLKKEAELQELEASALEAFTKMWSFKIEGEPCCVMLYLATDKDTVDIFCNDDEVHYNVTDVTPAGATFEFMVGGSYPARIVCLQNEKTGLDHTLYIKDIIIPEDDKPAVGGVRGVANCITSPYHKRDKPILFLDLMLPKDHVVNV